MREWLIEPINECSVFVNDKRLIRAIPQGSESVLGLHIAEAPMLVGWTPPQWKPALFSHGWAIGTTAIDNLDKLHKGLGNKIALTESEYAAYCETA